jgi:hypothetical protein
MHHLFFKVHIVSSLCLLHYVLALFDLVDIPVSGVTSTSKVFHSFMILKFGFQRLVVDLDPVFAVDENVVELWMELRQTIIVEIETFHEGVDVF